MLLDWHCVTAMTSYVAFWGSVEETTFYWCVTDAIWGNRLLEMGTWHVPCQIWGSDWHINGIVTDSLTVETSPFESSCQHYFLFLFTNTQGGVCCMIKVSNPVWVQQLVMTKERENGSSQNSSKNLWKLLPYQLKICFFLKKNICQPFCLLVIWGKAYWPYIDPHSTNTHLTWPALLPAARACPLRGWWQMFSTCTYFKWPLGYWY